jgi:hypothetical protein
MQLNLNTTLLWKLLPYGFLSSARRILTYREAGYDTRLFWGIYMILVSGLNFCSTDGASNTQVLIIMKSE